MLPLFKSLVKFNFKSFSSFLKIIEINCFWKWEQLFVVTKHFCEALFFQMGYFKNVFKLLLRNVNEM